LLNRRTIRDPLRRRVQRAVVSVLLAWLQVNLLWVAATHRHGELEIPFRAPAALQRGARQPQPPVEGWLICAACQIVRHSAAWPASNAPTFNTEVNSLFSPVVVPLDIPIFHPTALHGRAPPAV
jgi:hypothetical protein